MTLPGIWPEHIDALVGAVATLGAREIAPSAARWDEDGLDADLAARCADWGLFGVSVPEDRGGAGAGMLGAAAVMEELATHSGSLAVRLALHEGGAVGLALGLGDEPLLARLLGAGVQPESHSGATGQSSWVGWVGAGRGVCATGAPGGTTRLHGAARMVPGDGALVVVGREGDVVGLVAADRLDRRSRRGSGLRSVGWTDVALDVDLPRTGDAGLAAQLSARVSVLVGAVACGLARAAITQAVHYARVREQFGQPIANFQAIQWKLANGATERDAAWMLLVHAAGRLDAGDAGAHDAAARGQLAAVRAAVSACSEALQIHGGYGYTTEFPVERLLRDARACSAVDRGDDALRTALTAGIAARFA